MISFKIAISKPFLLHHLDISFLGRMWLCVRSIVLTNMLTLAGKTIISEKVDLC